MTAFKLLPVPANEMTEVRSADNGLRLTFPASSLSGDTTISIQGTSTGTAAQGELVRVGGVYAVTAASGQVALNAPAAALMHYPMDLTGVVSSTLQLHHWDAAMGKWVAHSSTVNGDQQIVSAYVNQLGAFAILGERTTLKHYFRWSCGLPIPNSSS